MYISILFLGSLLLLFNSGPSLSVGQQTEDTNGNWTSGDVTTQGVSPGTGRLEKPETNSDVSAEAPELTTAVVATTGTDNPAENEEEEEDTPFWRTVLDRVQVTMSMIGYTANTVTLVALVRKGSFVNPQMCLLLKNQSLVDSSICLMAAILLLQPEMWTTGVLWFDFIVCVTWHSQQIYWVAVLLSVWNLVLISAERYIAVCMPLAYIDLTMKRVRFAVALLYPLCILGCSMALVQCKFDFDNDECLTEYSIPGQLGKDMFYAFAIACLFTYYLIPIMIYVGMYSRILYSLRQRSKDKKLASSKTIEAASDSMTKAAIALTLIFIFSIGFDVWYYALGYTGVLEYVMSSPMQKIAVFLAIFNSCVNPFVYAVLMPAYRKSVRSAFCCCGDQDKGKSQAAARLKSSSSQSGSSLTNVSTVELNQA